MNLELKAVGEVGEVDKVDEAKTPASSPTSLPFPTSRMRRGIHGDRLRALNVPRRVAVVLGDDGMPKGVCEVDEVGKVPKEVCKVGEVDEVDEVKTLKSSPTSSTSLPSPISRRVEAVCEVWLIDDEWWRSPINRRYIEVVLEGGGHVVLYEDLSNNEWFMQKV